MADKALIEEARRRGLIATGPKADPALVAEAQRRGLVPSSDDIAVRGDILPLGRTHGGDLMLAWPGILKDMGESATLPGRVVKGEPYTVQDATKFALDYAVPLTARPAPGTLGTKAASKRKVISSAPSADDLAKQAGQKYTAARATGGTLNSDQYLDFVADLDSVLRREGIDPMLHPKATAVMNAMEKRLGQTVTVDDMMTIRRQMGIAARSVSPELADERRLAKLMIDKLDDVADNAPWGEARGLYARAKKVEIIDDMIEKAKIQASGVENGLRIQARQLLKDKKRIRGFTMEERAALKEIDKGASGTKLLRLLGKLSYGKSGSSNFLGGSIGVAGGAFVGGAPGAVAAPALGAASQKMAEAATMKATRYARALAGLGGTVGTTPRTLPMGGIQGVAGPLAGTQVPPIERHGDESLRILEDYFMNRMRPPVA